MTFRKKTGPKPCQVVRRTDTVIDLIDILKVLLPAVEMNNIIPITHTDGELRVYRIPKTDKEGKSERLLAV